MSTSILGTARSASEKWALPLFITRENKYVVGILMFIAAALLYLTSNHIHIFEPQFLPMSWIDRAIPFLPNTVWIYTSEYLLFAATYLLCRDMENLNKYFYSFLGLQAVSVLIFWLWPTTYPRDAFALPEDLNAPTYFLFNGLRQTDSPANCCPSLHVSSVYLCSFIYLDERKKLFPFFFMWGTAIAVTTLTTKQHYLIDVVVGFLLAVIMYWVFHKLVSYRPVGSQHKR